MKNLLELIDYEIEGLNEQDAEGHIWWNKFRDLVIKVVDSENNKL